MPAKAGRGTSCDVLALSQVRAPAHNNPHGEILPHVGAERLLVLGGLTDSTSEDKMFVKTKKHGTIAAGILNSNGLSKEEI